MRSEKMKTYEELKSNKNSKEYEEWFLKYRPSDKKEKKPKTKQTKKSKTKKTKKTKKNKTKKKK